MTFKVVTFLSILTAIITGIAGCQTDSDSRHDQMVTVSAVSEDYLDKNLSPLARHWRLDRELMFFADDNLKMVKNYFYTGNKRDKVLHWNGYDELIKTINYQYQQDLLIKETEELANGETSYKNFAYDQQKRLVETHFFNQQGNKTFSELVDYDQYGNKKEITLLSVDNQILAVVMYNFQNRLLKRETHLLNGEAAEFIDYDYDEQGRLVNSVTSSLNSVNRRLNTEISYDSPTQLTEWRYIDGQKVTGIERIISFRNNNNILVVRENYFDNAGLLVDYKEKWFQKIS